jgi:hypothetical protein
MREEIEWDEEALNRLKKVPFFVRSKARAKIEQAAKSRGLAVITVALMDEIKKQEMGS